MLFARVSGVSCDLKLCVPIWISATSGLKFIDGLI